jgi:acetyl-CoA acetyltransferase
MTSQFLSGKTAIAGIGATEFSKESGRSEMQLAVEAVMGALNDAGIDPSEVDGMSSYTMDNNPEIEIHRLIGGKELKFFSRAHYGGGAACAPVVHGAMAIASGLCDVVVVYRAMNERSGYRFGSGGGGGGGNPDDFESANFGWYFPYGLMTPASWVAMCAQRYMYEHGATTEDFGHISVACRDFAATNPNAWFYQQPITMEDHQSSRWVAEPLRLLDCCQESDGACALVMVSAERAKTLNKPPAMVRAGSQGAADDAQMMTVYYRKDITRLPEMGVVANTMYEMSGLGPDDIQTAILSDHFTPFEEFGFCKKGEAKHFVREGQHARGGRLPINTHGGQLGEAYIHGMNGILEGVRQIRGESVNQVANVENVLVSAGTGVPTSGLILGQG